MVSIFFIIMVIIPVVEIYFLVKVGQVIGAWNTIGVVVLIGIIGAFLAKSQGTRIIFKIQETMRRGQLPGKELVEGAMILIGGVLLITPGFFSDILGLFFLFPLTRHGLAYIAMGYFKKRMQPGQWIFSTNNPMNNTDNIDNTNDINNMNSSGTGSREGYYYAYTYTEPDEDDIVIDLPAIEKK